MGILSDTADGLADICRSMDELSASIEKHSSRLAILAEENKALKKEIRKLSRNIPKKKKWEGGPL